MKIILNQNHQVNHMKRKNLQEQNKQNRLLQVKIF